MSENKAVEHAADSAGRVAHVSRGSEEARRRWEEVRQMRNQVLARQDQVIQQTRAELCRHIERMRNTRATLVTPVSVRPPKTAPVAKTIPSKPANSGPRFDFDSRRVVWEQRRRDQ